MTPPVSSQPQHTPVASRNPSLALLERDAQPAVLADLLGEEAAAVPSRLWDLALHDPARAFLAEPGKGFRAALVELGWQLAGGAQGRCPGELAVALEWLHAGSLIVDDIEDGSLTRRGRPALHVSHGLPIALNTGNALYFQAQLLIERTPLPGRVRAELQSMVVAALVRCHHGQALDIAATVDGLTQAELPAVVRATTALKTGALMSLAAGLGAKAAGASGQRHRAVAQFGSQLGTALQMLDDLGSLLTPKRRDKAVEDLAGGHPTWPWAWLAESADPFTFGRLQHELRLVRAGGDPTAVLVELAERLQHVGRTRVAMQLDRTLAGLRAELGDDIDLSAVEDELERLRRSYG
jgi:geranylgeranyl pyrophosphate synthase